MQLTQKERMLLEDQKKHEEICIKKYTEAAQKASDPQLSQLFSSYADQERQHYQTVEQILKGQIPNTQQQQGAQAGQQGNQQQGGQAMGSQQGGQIQAGQESGQNMSTSTTVLASQQDADFCNDLLITEKYISGTYDTAIFEFTNPQIRQTLNHIQKEEQQHGEGIFNYMQQNGMYQVK